MSEGQGKKSTQYKNKYNSANYDSLRIVIPKGHKATVEAAASAEGESLNGYTNKALLARLGLQKWPDKQEDRDPEEGAQK